MTAMLLFPGSACAQTEGTADRWIAPDKALHVAGGFDAAAFGYVSAARLDWEPSDRRTSAVIAGLAAGLAKEVYDRFFQERPWSWKDLVADGVGIAILVGVTAAAEP